MIEENTHGVLNGAMRNCLYESRLIRLLLLMMDLFSYRIWCMRLQAATVKRATSTKLVFSQGESVFILTLIRCLGHL